MHAVEFTTELNADAVLTIPSDVAAQLPKAGSARVIILAGEAAREDDDEEWRPAAYEQFLRDDSPEDAIYDQYTEIEPRTGTACSARSSSAGSRSRRAP